MLVEYLRLRQELVRMRMFRSYRWLAEYIHNLICDPLLPCADRLLLRMRGNELLQYLAEVTCIIAFAGANSNTLFCTLHAFAVDALGVLGKIALPMFSHVFGSVAL